jgi:hypothetical protein
VVVADAAAVGVPQALPALARRQVAWTHREPPAPRRPPPSSSFYPLILQS